MGGNNRLISKENITFYNSILGYKADNSIIYLSSNRNAYYLIIPIYNSGMMLFIC